MNPEPRRDDLTREERAGDWCVRLASAALPSDQRAEFDAWLAEDPANSETFDKALDVWHRLHAVADTPELIGQRADALDALRRANRQRWSRRVASGLHWPFALAASLALLLVTTLLVVGERPQSFETEIGERRTFVLDDGSRMSLDAASEVEVDYEDDRRELVLLAGRAKFEVAKDAARPFSVTAGDRTVVATGTAFTVELVDTNVHVIVYEGRVVVVRGEAPPLPELRRIATRAATATRTDAAELSPGRELVASLASPAVQVVQNDVQRSLAWEGGQLNFADEPLSSAVERLNRYEENKLVVGDDRAGAIRVNGVFNAGDSEAFIEALAAAFPVRARREGERIVLSSREM